MAAASFIGRLKGACGKPSHPASKTAVTAVSGGPRSFGPAVLDECIRRQSQCFLLSARLRRGICIAVFGVQKAPSLRGRVQAFTKNGRALYGAAPSAPPSKVENEGRRRKKKCKTRTRQIWYAGRRAGPHVPCRRRTCGGAKQKQHTAPGVPSAISGFIFSLFPLTPRLFRPIMLIMYHHGLICPCAKNMPKIFVHFDDFCPGRRAALRGVTKKRNMLKK